MRSQISLYGFSMKSKCCLFFMVLLCTGLNAQIDRNRKEEINITSAFKPSIVRTGKIEFRADAPAQDTSSYFFNYAQTPFSFKTLIGPLEVKPLAIRNENESGNGTSLHARLGYGNLQNPFASLSYTSQESKKQFSLNLDHISAKGSLKDQQYGTSSISARYRNMITNNQLVDFLAGYDFDQYKLYGYDQNSSTISSDQLRQNFHHVFGAINYQQVGGNDGQFIIAPSLRFDYLITNRINNESQLSFKMPLSFRFSSKIHFKSTIDVLTVQHNGLNNNKHAKTMIQLPASLSFSGKDFILNGGVIPVLKHDKLGLLPEIFVAYSFPETGLKIKAGIHNDLNINSMYRALQFNPFVLKMDSLTIFHEQQIYAGFDLHSVKGLQLSIKTGLSTFRNPALFVNKGIFGNEFSFLNESLLTAIMLEANLSYLFNNNLSFSSNLRGYSFQKQEVYDEAYGLLPLELTFRLDWEPIKKLKSSFSTILWSGTMTQAANNVDVKLQDAADISLGVEYELNKKWALWIDLNNIANSRYQRWNQYPSFGFNFMAGVRLGLNKKDK